MQPAATKPTDRSTVRQVPGARVYWLKPTRSRHCGTLTYVCRTRVTDHTDRKSALWDVGCVYVREADGLLRAEFRGTGSYFDDRDCATLDEAMALVEASLRPAPEPVPVSPCDACPTPTTCAEIGCAQDRAEPVAAKSAGQLAYEADCALQPTYHDGALRRPWSQLCRATQDTWHRNPTPKPRAPTAAAHACGAAVAAMVPQPSQQAQARDRRAKAEPFTAELPGVYLIRHGRRPAGMCIVHTPGRADGYKDRACRLADSLARGRHSRQAGGYVMSPAAAHRFVRLYAEGYDANAYTGELDAAPSAAPLAPAMVPQPCQQQQADAGVDVHAQLLEASRVVFVMLQEKCGEAFRDLCPATWRKFDHAVNAALKAAEQKAAA